MIELVRLMEEGWPRVYSMHLERSLLPPRFVLVVAWGRRGWKPRRREERFETFEGYRKRAGALLRRRFNHGYRLVLGSGDALLREPAT